MKDTNYERIALAQIALDPDVLTEQAYTVDDFTAARHRQIFTALRGCVTQGKPTEFVTVAAEAGLDSAVVSEVFSSYYTAANAAYFAERLHELRTRRRLKSLAAHLDSAAEHQTVAECMAMIESELLGASAFRGARRVRDVVTPVLDQIQAAMSRDSELSGLPTGFRALDQLLDGWQPSEYYVIGARTNVGKTAIALEHMLTMAQKGHKGAIFSAEMADTKLVSRWISRLSGVENIRLRSGMFSMAELDRIGNSALRLGDLPIWIDDTPGIPITRLLSEARRLRRKENIEYLVVDYLTLVGYEGPLEMRREQVTAVNKVLRNLARELEIPVIALSQLNRETGADQEPHAGNIRESGDIEQDADAILMLWRQERLHDGTLLLGYKVEKQRNGPLGRLKLHFDGATARFREWEGE
jgi:replicative DNA helicase